MKNAFRWMPVALRLELGMRLPLAVPTLITRGCWGLPFPRSAFRFLPGEHLLHPGKISAAYGRCATVLNQDASTRAGCLELCSRNICIGAGSAAENAR